jgi:hypothetical protein
MSLIKDRIPILLSHIKWRRAAGERPMYIFGSGEAGRLLLEYLRAVDMVPAGFIDNNQEQWGLDLLELKIYAPEEVLPYDIFIIIASSWYKDIAKQLLQLGKRKGWDFADDFEDWMDVLCRYRFVNSPGLLGDLSPSFNQFLEKDSQEENAVGEAGKLGRDLDYPLKIKTNLPDLTGGPVDRRNEAEICFFIHNSMHAGDAILTRPFINELRLTYPKARIRLECPENRKYLWEDLQLPIVVYNGREYGGIEPTSNCPPEAFFINIWFGVFQDVLEADGLSYCNNIHTFNRFMDYYRVQHRFQLTEKERSPMVEFYRKPVIPFPVKANGILVENGPVFSEQSHFALNDFMYEMVQLFPRLNFYFAAAPGFVGSNVVDCSGLDLIDIAALSNCCVGLLTLGSGVNAASQTENNRYKPRCIVGWNYPWKVWYTPENPTFFAGNVTDMKNFLSYVQERQNL